ALRRSALLKGGASRLRIRLVVLFIDVVWHCALGSCVLRSFSNGAVTSQGKVMSKRPATKLSIAVPRLGTIVHSMPSRYGLPFFSDSGLRGAFSPPVFL